MRKRWGRDPRLALGNVYVIVSYHDYGHKLKYYYKKVKTCRNAGNRCCRSADEAGVPADSVAGKPGLSSGSLPHGPCHLPVLPVPGGWGGGSRRSPNSSLALGRWVTACSVFC
jgi:hypothetical protein